MKIEEINAILDNYEKLEELIHNKIKLLEKIDPKTFCTYRSVENIEFDRQRGSVYVRCDNSYSGYTDYKYICFPIEYLTLDEESLTQKITEDRIKREERELAIKLENIEKERKAKEKKELRDYNRLKKKFETNEGA